MVDVVNKTCQYENCETRATYGLLGNKPHHCAKHANKQIEILHSMRRCSKCNELATYGVGNYPTRCEAHTIEGDKDFETSVCNKCHLQLITDLNGICYYCNGNRNKTIRLFKQNLVVNYFTSTRNSYILQKMSMNNSKLYWREISTRHCYKSSFRSI